MNMQHLEREAWVSRLAEYACLRLTDAERIDLAERVEGELLRLDRLPILDGVADPFRDAVDLAFLRADTVGDCLDREALLSGAPDAREGFFVIPRLLGEEAEG